MTILAIDTSHPLGSVALQVEEREPDAVFFGSRSSHLLEIGASVTHLLNRAGRAARDIDRVALVVGPGSFTGLRIGLAFVKGLYAARGIDVVMMTSLELLALPQLAAHAAVCALIDARRSEVYAAVYEAAGGSRGGYPLPRLVVGPHAVEPGRLLSSLGERPVTFVGSGAVRFRSLIEERHGATFPPDPEHQPSTAVLCRVGAWLPPLSRGEMLGLEPYYIRPSDAELSLLRSVRVHDRREDRTDE
jgi:tRNA threonylcarbamoyladenosine biosynthesis protein TsaB